MYCIKVRSFAVATFILGHGIEPIDAVLIDNRPVFRFPPEADDAMDQYSRTKARLEALAHSARLAAVERPL
jgi:hypothetical protein